MTTDIVASWFAGDFKKLAPQIQALHTHGGKLIGDASAIHFLGFGCQSNSSLKLYLLIDESVHRITLGRRMGLSTLILQVRNKSYSIRNLREFYHV